MKLFDVVILLLTVVPLVVVSAVFPTGLVSGMRLYGWYFIYIALGNYALLSACLIRELLRGRKEKRKEGV